MATPSKTITFEQNLAKIIPNSNEQKNTICSHFGLLQRRTRQNCEAPA
jgi:hypothetical protein